MLGIIGLPWNDTLEKPLRLTLLEFRITLDVARVDVHDPSRDLYKTNTYLHNSLPERLHIYTPLLTLRTLLSLLPLFFNVLTR